MSYTEIMADTNTTTIAQLDYKIAEISLEIEELADLLRDNLVVRQPPPKDYMRLYTELQRLADIRQELYDAKYELEDASK